MRIKIVLLVLISSLAFNAGAQVKYALPQSPTDMTFRDFVGKAESIHNVRFFFREEWVNDLKVRSYGDTATIASVLNAAFRGTSLHFYIEASGNIIITDIYALKAAEAPAEKGKEYLPPDEQFSPEENISTEGNALIEIGNPAEKNMPGKVTISGYVTNKSTREPLAGVTVYVQKLSAGALTNAFGFYSLTIPRGINTVRFSSIGLREKKINVSLNGTGELNVEMSSMLVPLKEVVVSAERTVVLRRYEAGVEKINMTSFKLMPTSMGEPDIIRNIMLLPGVQTIGEGSTGFNVRGGSADQNLILLYNAPIYNSSHFFGFFSAINSDIIRDVTLYKGGIPSRYGGRISSVLDITPKEGNMTEFNGTAGISPITTHLMVEGPIIQNKLSYILSGRTTYSNYILKLVDDPALNNSQASFYDLNGKLTWDINKKNKIDFSSYYSHDAFMFNSDTLYRYNNRIFALQWRHFFTSRLFSVISVNNSNYDYEISSQRVPEEAFKLTHRINSSGFKADVNWFTGKNEANFGMEITRYEISPGSYLPFNDSSLVVPQTIEKEQAFEAALYADDKLSLTDWLSVDFGLRISGFASFGPQTVLLYDPNLPKTKFTVTDTLYYGHGEATSKYAGLEPRLSFNFRLTDKNSIKLNYNRTRQNLHLLSNSTSISPTDVWKLSDYYIKPQIGDQIAAGFYQLLLRNRIEASVEVYYKWIQNMVDFKGGTNLVMDDNIEKDIINMKGKAYGIEISLKKADGKFRYGISYTYSRTLVKSLGNFKDEILNSGQWFPANYDKPNDLIVTLNYIYSRRFSFSANYTWSTGRPITYPYTTYFFYNNLVVSYSDRNKYRVPYYSRLDLSCRISGNLKSHRIAHPSWTFSVYNLLGRENVYSVYFLNSDDFIKGYRLSVFGQAIPSVTFSFDF